MDCCDRLRRADRRYGTAGDRPRRRRQGHRCDARRVDAGGAHSRRGGGQLMAQLSNDCFAHGGALLPVDEAARLMAEHVPSVADAQPVTLADAAGRILAEDLIAPIALPAFDNSAVDGYAVRNADVAHEGETRLRVVDRVFAGSPAERVVGAGEAVHIFTGAPMPAGADTVYMQEDSKAKGNAVIVPAGLKIGANRRLAGEDIKAGALARPAGRGLQESGLA